MNKVLFPVAQSADLPEAEVVSLVLSATRQEKREAELWGLPLTPGGQQQQF